MILHTITAQKQYGYKTNLSTSDAIIKLGAYLESATQDAHIVLMVPTKAVGEVNRTLLRTTLYKKGIPLETIKRIRRGNKDTKLLPKTKNKYGKATLNNTGDLQGSAIGAMLFIIYKDDMVEDYNAINQEAQIPQKHTHKSEQQKM